MSDVQNHIPHRNGSIIVVARTTETLGYLRERQSGPPDETLTQDDKHQSDVAPRPGARSSCTSSFSWAGTSTGRFCAAISSDGLIRESL
jgi:hypothetical protein